DHQHDGREGVDAHAPGRGEAGDVYEAEELDDVRGGVAPDEADEYRPREDQREADEARGDGLRDAVADVTLQQAGERRREQRTEDDQDFGGELHCLSPASD